MIASASPIRDGRRGSSILVAIALTTLLASCALPSLPPLPWQTRGPTPLPDAQQIAHIALLSNGDASRMLDPGSAAYADPAQAQILALLYSSLFTLDARLRPIPALARGYSVSADGLRFTFHLRTDVRFSDGTALTSADVAFSLNRAMSGCVAYAPEVFGAVKDQPAFTQRCLGGPPPGQRAVTTLIGDALLMPDPYTIVIVLARPDGALISKLAEPYSVILEQSVVTHYGAQWPTHLADGGGQGTSGMYAVSAWKPWGPYTDGSLTLTVARDYWGQRPRLRQVIFALRTRESSTPTATSAYSDETFAIQPTDDIVLDSFSPALDPPGSAGKRLTYHSAPERMLLALALNPLQAPLDDVRVRQALALALDRTALAKIVNGQATNHLIPPSTGAYPAILSGAIASEPLTGDAAKARSLWQSYVRDRCGGDASRCPVVTIFVSGPLGQPTPFDQAVIARWQAMLPGLRLAQVGAIGMPMDENIPPYAVLPVYWSEDYPDPQDWLASFAWEPGGVPTTPMAHEARADALVARAETTLNPTARLSLYQQAENTLLNDAIAVPIAQMNDAWRLKSTVANFPANPAPWIPPNAWARIDLTTTPSA